MAALIAVLAVLLIVTGWHYWLNKRDAEDVAWREEQKTFRQLAKWGEADVAFDFDAVTEESIDD